MLPSLLLMGVSSGEKPISRSVSRLDISGAISRSAAGRSCGASGKLGGVWGGATCGAEAALEETRDDSIPVGVETDPLPLWFLLPRLRRRWGPWDSKPGAGIRQLLGRGGLPPGAGGTGRPDAPDSELPLLGTLEPLLRRVARFRSRSNSRPSWWGFRTPRTLSTATSAPDLWCSPGAARPKNLHQMLHERLGPPPERAANEGRAAYVQRWTALGGMLLGISMREISRRVRPPTWND